MSEQNNEGQQQEQQQEERQQPRQEQQNTEDRAVPYHRFKEVNENLKNVKQEMEQLRQEREEQERKTQEEQGKYQDLYKKESEKHQKTRNELQQLKAQIARNEKFSTFRSAAQNVILPEAIDGAFRLAEIDFGPELENLDAEDEGAFRAFAQRIVESNPYMAAGPRGTGSFGSRQPVLGGATGKTQSNGAIKLPIGGGQKRRFK